jgi:hypothetical protein
MARARYLNRRAQHWLIAMLVFSALAPSVSRALAASSRAGWVAICGAGGTRWVPAPQGTAPLANETLLQALHDVCALCSLGLDRGLSADPPRWQPLALAPVAPLLGLGVAIALAADHTRPAATGPPHTS